MTFSNVVRMQRAGVRSSLPQSLSLPDLCFDRLRACKPASQRSNVFGSRYLNVCMYVCMYVCVYVCMCVRICMYAFTCMIQKVECVQARFAQKQRMWEQVCSVYVYACMYVCVYIYIYIYMHTYVKVEVNLSQRCT